MARWPTAAPRRPPRLLQALLSVRSDPATARFDRELEAAAARGEIDAATARTLRWWRRESLRGNSDHLVSVLPHLLDDLAAARGAAARAVEEAPSLVVGVGEHRARGQRPRARRPAGSHLRPVDDDRSARPRPRRRPCSRPPTPVPAYPAAAAARVSPPTPILGPSTTRARRAGGARRASAPTARVGDYRAERRADGTRRRPHRLDPTTDRPVIGTVRPTAPVSTAPRDDAHHRRMSMTALRLLPEFEAALRGPGHREASVRTTADALPVEVRVLARGEAGQAGRPRRPVGRRWRSSTSTSTTAS